MTLELALGIVAVPLAVWVALRIRILESRLKALREKEHELSSKILAVLEVLGTTLTPEQREIVDQRIAEMLELQAQIAQLKSLLEGG